VFDSFWLEDLQLDKGFCPEISEVFWEIFSANSNNSSAV